MDDLLFNPLVAIVGLLQMAATSKQAAADERDRLLGTLDQLLPALELAASGASERFTAASTAHYANAVSDLHCQARLLGSTGLDALADSLGRVTPKLSKESLTVDEAKALLSALLTTAEKVGASRPD